ncbi:MAG: Gfo/Idh/MocA family oxidoreductase [Burkholderiaceae bacterium]|nr:Gfo/Idh/MocA family oxidoreductase [Burkholderiaceae bacterium]
MSGSKLLRVAAVGAGYFSRLHLEAWRDLPGVELVGLCDRDPVRLAEQAARHGIASVFGDAASMARELAPDIVDVTTPPATHHALIEQVLGHCGLVVCQKALAPSYAEAEAIVATCEAAAKPLVGHENFRFSPWYREAARMLREGALGTPHTVSFRLRPGDGQGPAAYLDRQPYFQQMKQFLVFETAIHFIDTFRFMMGEVEAVTARMSRMNPVISGEDAGYLIFEFASGATGLFDGKRLNDHIATDPRRTMGEMWLEGSAGVLRLYGEGRLWFKPRRVEESEHAYDKGPGTFAGGAVYALQAHVCAFARGEAPALAGDNYPGRLTTTILAG